MAAAPALPRRMGPASVKKEPPHPVFQLLNEQIYALAGTAQKPKLSGHSQLLAIAFIASRTMCPPRGEGDAKQEWTRPLTIAEFARKMGVARNSAWRILTDAEQRGLIESVGKSDAKQRDTLSDEQLRGLAIPWGDANAQAKRYRAIPANWKTAKPYEGPKAAPEPEEEEPAAPEPEEEEPAAPPKRAAELKPGKPWNVPLDSAAKKCYVTSRSENAHVRVETTFRESAIFLDVFVTTQGVTGGTVYTHVDGQKSGDKSPTPLKSAALFASDPRAAEIGRGLAGLRIPLFLDHALASQTARQLQCPVEFFLDRAHERVDRAARKGTPVNTGFVSLLVQNANEKWELAEPVERKRYEADQQQHQQDTKTARAYDIWVAQGLLKSPSEANPEDLAWARALLAAEGIAPQSSASLNPNGPASTTPPSVLGNRNADCRDALVSKPRHKTG